MYGGRRNVGRKVTVGRSTGYVRGRTAGTKRYPLSKVGGTVRAKPRAAARFATVAYTRDVETKYSDKAVQGVGVVMAGALLAGGYNGYSDGWRTMNFGGTVTPTTDYHQDLLKGVLQNTTAQGRIGNKINVHLMNLKITMTACYLLNATTLFENAQNGEAVIDSVATELRQYLRTTYRIVVIKDTQVNSADKKILYGDVFENDATTGLAGVHSELRVANMGRFKILHDQLVELRADNPQKTLALDFKNIGEVRYNGPQTDPASPALTDKGIYVVWASWVQGTTTITAPYIPQQDNVNVSRRLCFTDI